MSNRELQVGDRVRFTYEGEVATVFTSTVSLRMPNGQKRYFDRKHGTVEILQKPLAVGDEVTEENLHLLPTGRYILVDSSGIAWNGPFDVLEFNREYGPFTLVYIHDAK